MKNKFLIALKVVLVVLTLVFTFTNVTAGIAFLTIDKVALGIKLIVLTVIGYFLATILVFFKKEITAFILSAAGSIMLIIIRSEFWDMKDRSTAMDLYEKRNLPAISITAIILIFAIIKFVKLSSDRRMKKAQKDREKAPSIFK